MTLTLLHTALFHTLTIYKTTKSEVESIPFALSLKEIMLLSALISASDTVAAVSIISEDHHPKLASIIFGEGITNDAVAIILYKAVNEYTSSTETLSVTVPFTIIGNFLKMGIMSILVGVAGGLIAAIILRVFRFLSHSNIQEILILFC